MKSKYTLLKAIAGLKKFTDGARPASIEIMAAGSDGSYAAAGELSSKHSILPFLIFCWLLSLGSAAFQPPEQMHSSRDNSAEAAYAGDVWYFFLVLVFVFF